METKKHKPKLGERLVVCFFGVIALMVGYFLAVLFDGWKLLLSPLLIIFILWIIIINRGEIFKKSKERVKKYGKN